MPKINVRFRERANWNFTRGCTDHFATAITYLQFSVQVCFFIVLRELIFPIFSSGDVELWVVTLTYEFDPDQDKSNISVTGQVTLFESYRPKTHVAGPLLYTGHKVVGNAKIISSAAKISIL